MSARSSISSIAEPSSLKTWSLSALSLSGRLIVSVAIRSATVSVSVWKGMAGGRGDIRILRHRTASCPRTADMEERWILRRGTAKSGFRYVTAAGRRVTERRQLERIASLVIPPAWRDVHIAHSTSSMVQAWGIDARGRKQYRYHPRAVARRELRKYHRVRQLARSLPTIRRRLRED